jgi:hypothetical protein
MKLLRILPIAFFFLVAATSAFAGVTVGQPAPNFSLVDGNGATHSLSDYKGKIVVLEWNNPECPFVKKHYSSGNIPKQQADATAQGVVWLTINSGAPGKQGHLDGAGAKAFDAQYHATPTAYLLDADGKVGHLYGAAYFHRRRERRAALQRRHRFDRERGQRRSREGHAIRAAGDR